MKLLVLDSSGLVASVALIEDDQLIAEYTTGNKLTHSQTLLPMLDEVIKRTSFEIEDIDAVAQKDQVLLRDFALVQQQPKD